MSLIAFCLAWLGHHGARRRRLAWAAGAWLAGGAVMVAADGPLNGAITALLVWSLAGVAAVFSSRP